MFEAAVATAAAPASAASPTDPEAQSAVAREARPGGGPVGPAVVDGRDFDIHVIPALLPGACRVRKSDSCREAVLVQQPAETITPLNRPRS